MEGAVLVSEALWAAPLERRGPDFAFGEATLLASEDPDAGFAPIGRSLDFHPAADERLDRGRDDVAVTTEHGMVLDFSEEVEHTFEWLALEQTLFRLDLGPQSLGERLERLHTPDIWTGVENRCFVFVQSGAHCGRLPVPLAAQRSGDVVAVPDPPLAGLRMANQVDDVGLGHYVLRSRR